MKKTFALALMILLPLMFSSTCKGNFSVQPLELSITMDNEFMHGNISKKIKITNNNDYSLNVTWYLEHPNPISWMRPNRTCILSLSWIDLEPKWLAIPPNNDGEFYIYLDIPDNKECLDQHWETWVTFKEGEQNRNGGFFNQECAVRVYINTPEQVTIGNNQGQDFLSITIGDQIKVPLLDIALAAVIATILLIIVTLVIKKKKS